MRLFLDTANKKEIEYAQDHYLIEGVTTNPTSLSKESGDIKKLLIEICDIMKPYPVSIEITELEPDQTYAQAQRISKLASNVVVKIPCHMKYLTTIYRLLDENININITLLFSLVQGAIMSQLGVTYISPFVSRLQNIDTDGENLLHELVAMKEWYDYETEILAASLHTIEHVHAAIDAGVDIATIPYSLLTQLLEHPLTKDGLAKFDADWNKIPESIRNVL